jgi:hypothetical protein
MGVNKVERGKVVQQNVNGTIFDVRQVPKKVTDHKAGSTIVTGSSYALFIGKHKLKDGFGRVKDAGEFAVENSGKYNKKTKKFEC